MHEAKITLEDSSGRSPPASQNSAAMAFTKDQPAVAPVLFMVFSIDSKPVHTDRASKRLLMCRMPAKAKVTANGSSCKKSDLAGIIIIRLYS
jgi:hypothetical protein